MTRHKLVKALQPTDWYPTACGLRDSSINMDNDVTKFWRYVNCKKCLKFKPRRASEPARGRE